MTESNDPLLHPLIEATDEEERQRILERLVTAEIRPIVEKVIRQQANRAALDADAEDIAAVVVLRLVRRLQRVPRDQAAAIERLADFTATLTYNAIYDVLRRRAPEKTRLRNRIRHAVARDPRLATWTSPAGLLCGLASLRGSTRFAPLALTPSRAMLDRTDLRGATYAVLAEAGQPVAFDDLVRTLAGWWNVRDTPPPGTEAAADATQLARAEQRQYLERLWREILALTPRHRAALLLNLREGESGNAIALLVIVGVATIDEIAAALELTPERLAELWNNLPLDDLTIASSLGLSRQQVINLRRSARERLLRRMRQ